MELIPALDGAYGDRHDAVVVAGEAASWEDIRTRAEDLAKRIGGAPVIAVHASATLDTVVAVIAGLIAGVPVVPVPPDSGPLEKQHILSDSGATMLLGDGPEPMELPGAFVGRPALSGVDPALILYTSGTTGTPKGVVLSRQALAADLDALADAWAWTADDVLVHGLPLFHVHGLVLGVLGALRHGSRLVHTGRPTPADYAAARGTLYFGVPTVWSRVCAQPDFAKSLAGARLLVSGSAPLPVRVFEELVDFVAREPSVHKRPRRVVFVPELPRNALGKVQKHLLDETRR